MKKQTYLPMVGIDMLHYARVLVDTQSEYLAETPVAIPGLTEAGYNRNSQSSTFFADNGSYDTAVGPGELSAAIACADVPPKLRADIYGDKYNEKTGELLMGDPNPQYFAYLYRIQKSNGAYRYVTLYKMKALPNNESFTTKGGSINFATNGFSLVGAKRFFDGNLIRILDDDDPALPEDITPEVIEANYFTDVNWMVSAGLGTLIVSSEAGSESGKSLISILQLPATGNKLVYKVLTNAAAVEYDQELTSGWTEIVSNTEITATSDKIITVAEVTSDYKARKVGTATVVAAV